MSKLPKVPAEPKLPELPEELTQSILKEYKPRSEYPCQYNVVLQDKNDSFDAGEIVKRYEAIINLELNQRLEAGFKNYVLRRFNNIIFSFKTNTYGRENLNRNKCYVSNYREMGLYQSLTFSYIKRDWDDTTLEDLAHKMDNLMVTVLMQCFSGPDTPLVPLNQATGINVRQHYKIKKRHGPYDISYRLWRNIYRRKQYSFILLNNKQLPLNKESEEAPEYTITQLLKY